MQVNFQNIGEIFIAVWFAVSVLGATIGNVVFLFWLRRRGVNLVFALTGMPGYMDKAYYDWCRLQGRSSKRVLFLRTFSIINVIVSAIFFIIFK
jgi:hypothetical protein